MNGHFDTLETRNPEQREHWLLAQLPRQIAHAKRATKAFAKLLADVEPGEITSREALARLPVLRKSRAARHAEGGAPVRRLRRDALG